MALAHGGSISDVSFSCRLTERRWRFSFEGQTRRSVEKFTGWQRCVCCTTYWLREELNISKLVIAKELEGCVTDPCCLVIVPLRSIVEEQVNYNDFGMTAIDFEKSNEALKDIKSNKYKLIYASAEQALSSEFLNLLKDDSSELKKSLSLIVVDESHTFHVRGVFRIQCCLYKFAYGTGIPNFQGTFCANTGRLLRILRDFYSDMLSNQLG